MADPRPVTLDDDEGFLSQAITSAKHDFQTDIEGAVDLFGKAVSSRPGLSIIDLFSRLAFAGTRGTEALQQEGTRVGQEAGQAAVEEAQRLDVTPRPNIGLESLLETIAGAAPEAAKGMASELVGPIPGSLDVLSLPESVGGLEPKKVPFEEIALPDNDIGQLLLAIGLGGGIGGAVRGTSRKVARKAATKAAEETAEQLAKRIEDLSGLQRVIRETEPAVKEKLRLFKQAGLSDGQAIKKVNESALGQKLNTLRRRESGFSTGKEVVEELKRNPTVISNKAETASTFQRAARQTDRDFNVPTDEEQVAEVVEQQVKQGEFFPEGTGRNPDVGPGSVPEQTPEPLTTYTREVKVGDEVKTLKVGPPDQPPPKGGVTPDFADDLPEMKDIPRHLWEGTKLDVIRAMNIMEGEMGAFRRGAIRRIEDQNRIMASEVHRVLRDLGKRTKAARMKKWSEGSNKVFRSIDEPEAGIALSAEEQAVKTFMRTAYKDLLDKQNEVRKNLNLEPINELDNYINHFWDQDLTEEIFGLSNEAGVTGALKVNSNSPFLPHAFHRKGVEGYTQDAIAAFETYVRGAMTQIHMSEAVAAARPFVDKLPPNAKEYFTRFLNSHVLNKRTNLDKTLPEIAILGPATTIANKLAKKAAEGLILGNPSTVANQFSSIPLAAGEAGFWAMFRGGLGVDPKFRKALQSGDLKETEYFKLLQEGNKASDQARGIRGLAYAMGPGWDFARKHSSALADRRINPLEELNSIVDDVTLTPWDGFKRKLQWFVETADQLAVSAVFNIGYLRAIEKKGLKGMDAIRYADDFSIRQQGSFNRLYRAPILANRSIRFATQFQTWPITIWNHLRYDIGGGFIRPEKFGRASGNIGRKEQIKQAMRFGVMALATNEVFNAVGLPTPFDSMFSFFPFSNYIRQFTATAGIERPLQQGVRGVEEKLSEATGLNVSLPSGIAVEENVIGRAGSPAALQTGSNVVGGAVTGLTDLLGLQDFTDQEKALKQERFLRNLARFFPAGNVGGKVATGLAASIQGETLQGKPLDPFEGRPLPQGLQALLFGPFEATRENRGVIRGLLEEGGGTPPRRVRNRGTAPRKVKLR